MVTALHQLYWRNQIAFFIPKSSVLGFIDAHNTIIINLNHQKKNVVFHSHTNHINHCILELQRNINLFSKVLFPLCILYITQNITFWGYVFKFHHRKLIAFHPKAYYLSSSSSHTSKAFPHIPPLFSSIWCICILNYTMRTYYVIHSVSGLNKIQLVFAAHLSWNIVF